MPGASKKRGKLDRQAARGAGQGSSAGPATQAPPPAAEPAPAEPVPAEPVPYDGPSDNRGGPAASRPQGGHSGRPPPNAPGQSSSQAPAGDAPSEASSRPRVDPAKEPSLILNKNIDFPANAYNLVSQVSSRCG